VPNPIDEGVVSLVGVGTGASRVTRRFAAASQRTDFPTRVNGSCCSSQRTKPRSRLQEARYVVSTAVGARLRKNSGKRFSIGHERRTIRQDERELRLLVDFVPQVICEVESRRNASLHESRSLEYFGRTLDELTRSGDPRVQIYHPR